MMDMYSLLMGGGSGGGGGGSDIVVVHDNGALDKTWQEIHDAMASGKIIISVFEEETEEESIVSMGVFTGAEPFAGEYICFAIATSIGSDTPETTVWRYATDNANGYPVYAE